MIISAKQKIYYLSAGLAIIFLAGIIFVFGHYASAVIAESEFLAKAKIEQDNWAKKRSSFSVARDNYKKIEPVLAENNNFFPSENEVINTIVDLEAIAGKTGNQITIDIVSQADPALAKQFVSLRLSLFGSYSALMKFLKAEENMPVFLQPQTINTYKLDEANLIAYHLDPGGVKSVIELAIKLNDQTK